MCMINGIPAVTYMLILSGLAPPIVDWFGHPSYTLRYVQWCFTTPALLLLVAHLANKPMSAAAPAMVVDIAMVITGWCATWAPMWYLWFTLSSVCFAFVMYKQWGFLGAAMRCAMHKEDAMALRGVRAYTMVIWSVFPLAWLLHAGGLIGPRMAQVLISSCDIGAKLVHSSILRAGNFMSVNRISAAKELVKEDVLTDATTTDARLGEMSRLVSAAVEESRGRSVNSSLLSTLSHELRTPLNAIVGFNSMLLDAPIPPDEKQSVYRAVQAAQSLEEVITNVIFYSDYEQAGLPVSVLAAFNLEHEIEAVLVAAAGAWCVHVCARDMGFDCLS